MRVGNDTKPASARVVADGATVGSSVVVSTVTKSVRADGPNGSGVDNVVEARATRDMTGRSSTGRVVDRGGRPAGSTVDRSGAAALKLASETPESIEARLAAFGFAADDSRVAVARGLAQLAPKELTKLFKRLEGMRGFDAEAFLTDVRINVIRGAAFEADPAGYVARLLTRFKGSIDPRWRDLASNPKGDPKMRALLDTETRDLARNGVRDYEVSIAPDRLDAAAQQLREALLDGLRLVEPDLMGEVLARFEKWPSLQRKTIVLHFAYPWRDRIETRGLKAEDADHVRDWLRYELARPLVVLAFEDITGWHANTSSMTRLDAKDDPAAVDIALKLATLKGDSIAGEHVVGQIRAARKMLILSKLSDPRIDAALRSIASRKFNPKYDMDVWKAEYGLLRRGQETNATAILATLDRTNLSIVHWLAKMHFAGEAAVPAPIAKKLRERVAADEQMDDGIARMMRDVDDGPLVTKFVRDVGLRGLKIDEAIAAAS